jgi:hypothetical protein
MCRSSQYMTLPDRYSRQTGPMTTERSTSTRRITGTFTLDSWEQDDVDVRDGTGIAKAHVTKTLSGDLVGTSTADLLLAGTQEGSRAYCGFERITGTIAGRTGSFVLRHTAEGDAAGGWLTWQILPGSGTGELAGVLGEGQIDKDEAGHHTFWLDLGLG